MDGDRIPRELPRAERLVRIMERDGAHCVWCRRPLAPGHRDASLEHLVPRSGTRRRRVGGGPAWPENELCACRPCNRRRGHTAPDVFLADCEARGLAPDRPAIERSLLRLQAAIEERGGQRRARPYLAAQLRRLGLAATPAR